MGFRGIKSSPDFIIAPKNVKVYPLSGSKIIERGDPNLRFKESSLRIFTLNNYRYNY